MLEPKKGAKKTAATTSGATKSGATKSGAKKSGGGSDGLQRPLKPSADLAAITGSGNIARSDVVSKMWDYIKKNNLQNPENKREILADDKLEKIFGVKKVTMFEMNKHLSRHLSQP